MAPVTFKQRLLWSALATLVAAHWLLILGFLAALPYSIAEAPWHVAVPQFVFTVWFTLSRVADCPLTRLENVLRKALGLKPIGGFIGHYFKRPIWRHMGWKRGFRPVTKGGDDDSDDRQTDSGAGRPARAVS